MTKLVWNKLSKEIDNKERWNKELYKRPITKFDDIKWKIVYKDGTVKEFTREEYPTIDRKNVKAVGVLNHLMPVTDDVFAFRMRNIARGLVGEAGQFGFDSPKRCIIIYTKNEIAWIWDDGDIDELPTWGDQEPYTPFNLAEFEK